MSDMLTNTIYNWGILIHNLLSVVCKFVLVHQGGPPSTVWFIEGSSLANEGAEIRLVLILGRCLVAVALRRQQICEPEKTLETFDEQYWLENLWRNSGSYRLTGRGTVILVADSCSLSSTYEDVWCSLSMTTCSTFLRFWKSSMSWSTLWPFSSLQSWSLKEAIHHLDHQAGVYPTSSQPG